MDDLKLYANNDNNLESLLEVVQEYSDDVRMNFGLDKCNKLTIKKGKTTASKDIVLSNNDTIKALDSTEVYKYLGMIQNSTIKTTEMKRSIQDEYFERLKKIMKTSLNSKNTIDAVNTFATPTISYGFAVLDWSVTELEAIDRETRNVLKKYHLFNNNSDVTRLYLPRRDGGRGLVNITDQYKNQIVMYSCYLRNTEEQNLTLVSASQVHLRSKSIHEKAQKYSEDLGEDVDHLASKTKLQVKNQLKKKRIEQKKQQLSAKEMHGQYLQLLDEPHIDKDLSTAWLRDSRLKRPTEAAICAIQEQAVTTNYVRKHIHKSTNDDTCRVCKASKETIHHVISGCSVLAPTKYVQRHDNLCKYVHMLLARKYDLLANDQVEWYAYDPDPVLENEHAKILWNFPVQTDHTVRHNKPDILLVDKNERHAIIIDIAVPSDYNITRKRAEKIQNYQDLSYELKQIWQVDKVTIVPVIIGATGVIHKGFEDIKTKLDIKMNTREAQKIVILGTVNICRTFFQTNL